MQLVGQLGLEFDETIVGHLMRLEGAASLNPHWSEQPPFTISSIPKSTGQSHLHTCRDREARASPMFSLPLLQHPHISHLRAATHPHTRRCVCVCVARRAHGGGGARAGALGRSGGGGGGAGRRRARGACGGAGGVRAAPLTPPPSPRGRCSAAPGGGGGAAGAACHDCSVSGTTNRCEREGGNERMQRRCVCTCVSLAPLSLSAVYSERH
jgi:hypothetical protein